ncbi:MAG: ATP-binding protein [Candidatus Berkiella sp.]
MKASLEHYTVDFEKLLKGFPTPYLVFLVKWPLLIIVACSDSYLTVTKADRDHILGKDVFEAFPPLESEEGSKIKSDFIASFERVLQTKATDVMGVQRYDVPNENNPDEFIEKYWTVTNSPVLSDKGDVEYIIQKVEDITEYILLNRTLLDRITQDSSSYWSSVEAEIMRSSHEVKEANRYIKVTNEELERNRQQLITTNDKLKELDRLKTEFFSNISHEFRTPLTLMLAPLEELLANNKIDKNAFSNIELVHRNALRLLKLVNNLLDFSKLEAGRVKAAFQPCDLSKLTKELSSHFYSTAKQAGIEFIVDCPALPELIYIDIDAYEKILFNLLSNAFKHTLKGSIEITLLWVNNGVELIVKDTGVGIPQDLLEHIFERFYRINNPASRTHEGTGIGLSLTQELVKLHQGKITAASTLQQGSTFTVWFSAGKNHLPQEQISLDVVENHSQHLPFLNELAPILEQPDEIISEPFPSKRERVLLVDDNPDMRSYIKKLLDPYYDVALATNGKEAYDLAQSFKPNLILSDVMMPVMNGVELVQAIRHNEELKLVPIILLSARAGEEIKIEGLETGANDYVIKPFNATELLTRIKTNLTIQEMQLQIHQGIENVSKMKDQFISNMSHELRTPLNAIIGYSEMIVRGMVNNEAKKQTFIENILKAGRHLLTLINDILDISKITAGKFTLHFKSINLREFVDDIHILFKELASNKKVTLKFHIPDNINSINADPLRLKQIMINLLNNAIKFNRENGTVNVSVMLEENHQSIHWKISDTGIGIPQEKIDQLFSEFYQIDSSSSRSYEGSGLGLALTKKLINLHGGQIWVESKENVGSTFSFTLPISSQHIPHSSV